MAQEPQHPDNPYRASLPESEQTPAKIWELLRRNEKFHRAVSKLQHLDSIAKSEYSIGQAWFAADSLVKTLKNHHEFAGHALQWLVPDPLFIVRKVTIPKDIDLTSKQWVSLDTITEGQSSSPDFKKKKQWQWRRLKPGQPKVGGSLMRRGPMVEWQTSAIPRFHRSVNPFTEWRQYANRYGSFTLAHSWQNTPPQFRRIFCWLWRNQDSRAKDSCTGQRFDAPTEHETTFFQGWSLLSAIGKNNIEQDGLARAFTFDNLAQNYRVFAFPSSIRTRSEARRMADWVFGQLAANLPAREPDLFGSPLQWDILLTVEDLMRDGAQFDEALQESFEKIHLKADDWHEGQPMPDQKKGWAQRGADWQKNYRVMHAPLAGTGLVQKIFPGPPRKLPSAM